MPDVPFRAQGRLREALRAAVEATNGDLPQELREVAAGELLAIAVHAN